MAKPLVSLKTMYAVYKLNWRCTLEYYVQHIKDELNRELSQFCEKVAQELETTLSKSLCFEELMQLMEGDEGHVLEGVDGLMHKIQE